MNTHDVLRELVRNITCKPTWVFRLGAGDDGTCLIIHVTGPNSRGTDYNSITPHLMTIAHYFPVPEATYNLKSWRRWVFECCRKVEDHELGEWFLVNGERPFAPLHGPGCDPYMVREVSTEEEARTNQDGSRG